MDYIVAAVVCTAEDTAVAGIVGMVVVVGTAVEDIVADIEGIVVVGIADTAVAGTVGNLYLCSSFVGLVPKLADCIHALAA